MASVVSRGMKLVVCALVVVACSKADPPAPAAGPAKPHHEDRHDKAVATPTLRLDVTVDGAAATWQHDAFDKVGKFVGKNNDGEARDVWSLRDLAHANAGPTARVVKVIGADDAKPISLDAWNDPARTPIIHNTRRGTLKFRWADKDGAWLETEVVKDVAKLELVAK